MGCMNAVKQFIMKIQSTENQNQNYTELRQIFTHELDHHKNESNFDQFDWQIIR